MAASQEKRVVSELEQLASLREGLALMEGDKAQLIQECIPAEVREHIQEIENRYATQLTDYKEQIAALEKSIKGRVLNMGASVKAPRLHAVFTRGSRLWNLDGLDGYALARPEILALRSDGEPCVKIYSSK